MNSIERVRRTILGQKTDRIPIYGWLFENLTQPISEKFGSVAAFEDLYEFDMAHIFGTPTCFNTPLLDEIKNQNGELTPDLLVDADYFMPADRLADYDKIKKALEHHKKRERFCYVQTPGFFEHYNKVFGIENQLAYLVMYPDELNELYTRQEEWTLAYVDRCIDLGVDMIHISDDWGAQNNLLFNPTIWREMIFPHVKRIVDHVHSRGRFCSLHSDGCIEKVADGIAELGFDLVHPWQESAGMSYPLYLEKYRDKFAILGGICVQTALGLIPQNELASEIRRVFETLKGQRWICCTTHFVQNHCSIEDLTFAYDLIYKLAREIN